jgi:enoyl-[acyl-carrier protein] reductase I
VLGAAFLLAVVAGVKRSLAWPGGLSRWTEAEMVEPEPTRLSALLGGAKALVVGVANEHSIAWGCAKALRRAGADLALTYLNDRAKPFVAPLAEKAGAESLLPLDVRDNEQVEAVFADIARRWGRLDVLVHSIAYAPKPDLQGRVVDSSTAGFLEAMDVSCHSFVRLARYAEPLMRAGGGGTLVTMTYHGARTVIPNYGLMGPVKAALEAAVRYLAVELGPAIRVHAVSPGPLETRAASGLKDFGRLLEAARERAPARRTVSIDDVGRAVAFLCSPYARLMTGETLYVDGGYGLLG